MLLFILLLKTLLSIFPFTRDIVNIFTVVYLEIMDGDTFLSLVVAIPNIVTIVTKPITLTVTIGLSMVCLKVTVGLSMVCLKAITKTPKSTLFLPRPMLVWLISPHLLSIFMHAEKDDKTKAQFSFCREQFEAFLTLIQPSQNDSSLTIVVHQRTTKSTGFVFFFFFLVFL